MSKEILVFTAGFCPSCPNWKQMLDSKDVEYKAIDIDTDEGAALATKYSVRALPTTLIFREGYLDRRIVGMQNAKVVEEIKED